MLTVLQIKLKIVNFTRRFKQELSKYSCFSDLSDQLNFLKSHNICRTLSYDWWFLFYNCKITVVPNLNSCTKTERIVSRMKLSKTHVIFSRQVLSRKLSMLMELLFSLFAGIFCSVKVPDYKTAHEGIPIHVSKRILHKINAL